MWPHYNLFLADHAVWTGTSPQSQLPLPASTHVEQKPLVKKNNIFTKQKHVKPKLPTSICDVPDKIVPRLSSLRKKYTPSSLPLSKAFLNTTERYRTKTTLSRGKWGKPVRFKFKVFRYSFSMAIPTFFNCL